MQIPSFFYGLDKDVKSRCRGMVNKLKNGATWNEAINFNDIIDTKNNNGLILLHGSNPLLATSPHFHCYLPLSHVFNLSSAGKLPVEIEEQVFAASLQTNWGLLGLLSQTNVILLYPQQRYQPFLQAIILFWDILVQEGNRYSNGSNNGENLWNLHTNIKYVLANLGVSQERLNQPLPSGGLKALLE